MRNLQVVNNNLAALMESIGELERLSSKEHLSEQEQRRNTYLLSKISALKSGVTADELRNATMARIFKETGRGEYKPCDERDNAWHQYVRTGQGNRSAQEVRAMQTGTQSLTYSQGAAGGYFVPPAFHNEVFEAMVAYDEIFDAENSNVITTDNSNVLAVPVLSDFVGSTPNAATLVTEAGSGTEVDDVAASVQLGAYTFRSGMVFLSLELAQDAPGIADILNRAFARRFALGVGKKLVLGSGSAQPNGLVAATLASGVSPVVAAGSSSNDGTGATGANSIGSQDITKLIHALDRTYRPGARFYMSDSTLQSLDLVLDKGGRPLVWPGFELGGDHKSVPSRIGPYPIVVCPSMDSISATKNTVVFGHPKYFLQRRVAPASYCRMFRETSGLIEKGLIGVQSFMRVDSQMVLGGSGSPVPFQILQQHS